jgi:hypothetical protein
MIIYRSTVEGFLDDVLAGNLQDVVLAEFAYRMGRRVAPAEVESWRNSMSAVGHVLGGGAVPISAGVAIEYVLAPTGKRIDLLIAGLDSTANKVAVIVELKQWTHADTTAMDGVVRTFVGGGIRDTTHPSYQAVTYARTLEYFNEAIAREKIRLLPCAYLHNCVSGDTIRNPIYKSHLDQAPVFLQGEGKNLREYISGNVRDGDKDDILDLIDKGPIRPSKSLADAIRGLIKGNPEFLMIDDQKVVYEKALELSKRAKDNKQVFIVEGGPGTGKSVVAVNLLTTLTGKQLNAQYVSRNAAPRAVYASKLTGTIRNTEFQMLFSGSGSFVNAQHNAFDALIVDEAHRLNEKSGLYQNLGENQILEIIRASRLAIFFIDEDQRVTLKDIGTRESIRAIAEELGADVTETKLESQFRCNGSDGYLAWVDHTLQVRDTANPTLDGIKYDFRVCESPSQLRDQIVELNKPKNRARMVAGYCWKWPSKNDPRAMDIVFPEDGFAAQWNLSQDGGLWIMAPESVAQVGCIHTCQGLELDYVGVIVGPDFIVRNGEVVTDALKRAS